MAKAWGGRFEGKTDPRVEKFTESISFDTRLAAVDIRGSQAHARMLAHVGLVTPAECESICATLDAIVSEAVGQLGPIDIVSPSPGIIAYARAWEYDDATWEEIEDTLTMLALPLQPKAISLPAVPHFTASERAARGRSAREECPRSSHAGFELSADRAEFLARLFARKKPDYLNAKSSPASEAA